jgi:hypothetical protein
MYQDGLGKRKEGQTRQVGNGNGEIGNTKKRADIPPQLLVGHKTYQDMIGGYWVIGYQGKSIRE